ncbi:MAG: hypothetical protein RBT76_10210 [candidate division Zixibacteria bacterium]|jgi:hypothetical protein|nr:hypothetical protein [candidate division Zixibacteria bacterium]
MKVNPLGIQTYQHLTRRDSASQQPATSTPQAAARAELAIEPQQSLGSKLAVQGPSGSYAEYLSEAERKAMELLFARFQETGRFTGSGGNARPTVGRLVDVKV